MCDYLHICSDAAYKGKIMIKIKNTFFQKNIVFGLYFHCLSWFLEKVSVSTVEENKLIANLEWIAWIDKFQQWYKAQVFYARFIGFFNCILKANYKLTLDRSTFLHKLDFFECVAEKHRNIYYFRSLNYHNICFFLG